MDAIKEEDYELVYDKQMQTISWSGVVRLREAEYRPISELLARAADSKAAEITLNLRELSFLNSGGINVLSRFMLQVRNHQASHLIIQANQDYAWQRKSLRSMQRLMRGVKMDLVWE